MALADTAKELEAKAEAEYNLPAGILASIRQQETGGQEKYLADPTTPHYPESKKSTAYGPYGILKSTAAQPGYGTAPLTDNSLPSQVNFAAQYLAGRIKNAGSVEKGLAGYGEGTKYANQVLSRLSGSGTPMATQQSQQPTDMQAAANKAIAATDAGAAALAAFQNQFKAVTNSAIATLEGTKEDAALIAETKGLGEAKAQQRTLDFATKIGANPDASTEALSKLVERSNKLFEQQRNVAARLENAGNPSTMFDSPVRWLADYLLVPYNKQRLGAVNDQLKSTTDQIKWINSTTQDVKQTMDAIAITKTTDTAAAAARNAKAVIDLEVAKQQAEALRFNSTNLTNTVNMTNNAFSIRAKVVDQANQEAQIAEMRATRELQQKALQMSLNDKETEQEAKNSYLEAVNLGAQNTGTPQFKSWQELEIFRSHNPQAASILAVNWTNGRAQLEGAPPTIASTPYAALTFKVASGAQLDPARTKLMDKINGVYGTLERSPKEDVKKALSNAKTAPALVNSTVANKAKVDAGDITAGGEANFYAPPPLAALQQDAEFAKTYLSSNILKALGEAGAEAIPFDKAIPLLLKDVNEGKVSVQQADSELNFLAHKIMGMNNDMYRYDATAGIPNMKSVKVPVKIPDAPGFFRAPIVSPGPGVVGLVSLAGEYAQMHMTKQAYIDLADPVARSTMFNKSQAAQLKIAPQTSKVN